MELGVRVRLDAAGRARRPPCVPGRLLLDVVRSLPKDDLSLEYRSAQQDVEVVSGSATLPPAHAAGRGLPEAARGPERRRSLSVPAAAFVETIARVARAASRDETRPHLTGVLVSAAGSELRMVATDSYRLASRRRARRGARGLARGERSGANAAGAGPDRRRRRRRRRSTSPRSRTRSCSPSATWSLSSRLVEGRFPNYQQLLPESYEHELRVSRAELLDVVRRISLLAQKNAPLRLAFRRARSRCPRRRPDVGEASESLPVPFRGRDARDRLQPGVLPRRPRERRVRGARPEADQPAAAGPDPVGRRRAASSTSSCRSG